MPQQITRLLIVFLVLGAILLVARHFLIPKTFGALGHYRAVAVDANASQRLSYAGHEECTTCHPDIVQTHDEARHRNVACEVCHGPAAAHVENPVENKPSAPRQRGYCPLCHGYDPSRPTGFPQIDPITHNPVQPCITCHNPHAPVPPRIPQECGACHGEIAKTKGFSKHALVSCTECHTVREAHKVTPVMSKPTKPETRESCGKCHGLDAKGSPEIVRVDMATHWNRYVCWQCHYSHFPEAQ